MKILRNVILCAMLFGSQALVAMDRKEESSAADTASQRLPKKLRSMRGKKVPDNVKKRPLGANESPTTPTLVAVRQDDGTYIYGEIIGKNYLININSGNRKIHKIYTADQFFILPDLESEPDAGDVKAEVRVANKVVKEERAEGETAAEEELEPGAAGN